MSIRLLFFGATVDEVGARSLSLTLRKGEILRDIIARVSEEYPGLLRHKLLCAVNQEYVPADVPLTDGDEVAIFTPVSGG